MPSTSRIPIFRSKEEAERETGAFSVSCLKLSGEIAKRIDEFVGRECLRTWVSADKTKRYTASYTLKFDIKHYHSDKFGNPVDYAYLRKGGKYGDHKSAIEHSIAMYGGGGLTPSEELHKDHEMLRVREKMARTPDLEQIFFWVCQKYPNDILWLEYTCELISLNTSFPEFDDADEFLLP